MRVTAALLAPLLLAWVGSGCSESDDIPAPQVSTVSPPSATPGAIVTVDGAYFCQQPDTGNEDPLDCDDVDGVVWFGTVPGSTTLWTDTAISVEVPSGGSGNVQLYVSATGRSSNSVGFTIE